MAYAQVIRGQHAHCSHCELSVRVIDSPLPAVCPFCHRSMEVKTFYPKDPTPEPPEVLEASTAQSYRKASPHVVLALSILIILLLTGVVFLKVLNLNFFWYQPWINTYSIIVGIFILSRFILAAFYDAPPDVGYEPTVTVVVACMNEEGSIEKTIGRAYREGYPHEKLDVIVVNDGSTDNTLVEMYRAQERHPGLVVVDFEKNRGKRHGMAVGSLLARSEILVMVDSDSFLMQGAIRKVVQGLADPSVAAVSGHTDVENVHTNVLTKMQDCRYFVSYRVMKAAEGLFGAVSCCPGCFSAYRRVCVLHVLERWLYQKFLGSYATFGDDRSLTNFLLRDYKVLYDDEALATTIVPEKWKKYMVQQCRWKRSWVREMLFAGRFMWQKHPVASISWYAMTTLPVIAPLVMFRALFWNAIVDGHTPAFYLGGVAVVTLLWGLYYLEKTGRSQWWTAFVFMMTYIFFFSWQTYYSLLTMGKTTWGTRG